jgi:hypothetical protein
MYRLTARLVLALLFAFIADAEAAQHSSPHSVAAALRGGIAWAWTQQPFNTGDLWLMSKLDDADLRRRVRATCLEHAGELGPFEGLVRPGVVGREMPAEWSRLSVNPYSRIGVWLFWAANAPGRAPPPAVCDELLTGEYSDYLLTHQYLTLRLLNDRHTLTGPRIRARLARLVTKIEQEQDADSLFSDLFAERAALLLSAGRVTPRARRWVETILACQEPDHRWRVRPHPYPTQINDLHTTLLCLWTLDQYRRIGSPLAVSSGIPGAGNSAATLQEVPHGGR